MNWPFFGLYYQILSFRIHLSVLPDHTPKNNYYRCVYVEILSFFVCIKCGLYGITIIWEFYCLAAIVNSCKIGGFNFEWKRTCKQSKFRFEVWQKGLCYILVFWYVLAFKTVCNSYLCINTGVFGLWLLHNWLFYTT